MLSLRALLAGHSSLLLIDSSSTRIQVGFLRPGHAAIWESHSGEAGVGVFKAAEAVLTRAARTIQDVESLAFCEGPGSVLGIRTAAAALRTWNVLRPRPLFAFCSLSLVAHQLVRQGSREFGVVADARRDSWHRVAVDAQANLSALERVPTSSLHGALFMPDGFRHWSPLPPGLKTTLYDVPTLCAESIDVPLFSPTAAPDAFLHEEPVYQSWTPQVHQAPR